MQEPKQSQETALKMTLSVIALSAVVALGIFLLIAVGGPVLHMLWWLVLLVAVVAFVMVYMLLFVGGNNPRQNAAAFRRLPTEDKLAETCSKWPPDDNPYWA